MNPRAWVWVVLGGIGVSGLALALGAPVIPSKLAFWGAVFGVLAWRGMLRGTPQ